MRDYITLPSHVLHLAGILVQIVILVLAFYLPVANRLWMFRAYLCMSLVRTLFLSVVTAASFSTGPYYHAFCVWQIIGHVFLLLMAVELMGMLLAREKRIDAMFYSIAVAFMIVAALSMIHLPATHAELANFMQKALAMALFVLLFAYLTHPQQYWPYTGIAHGLSVMLTMDFVCALFQQWSLGHNGAHYSLVGYGYQISSLTGYVLWLRAITVYKEPKKREPVSHQTLMKMKDALRSYRAAVGSILKLQ